MNVALPSASETSLQKEDVGDDDNEQTRLNKNAKKPLLCWFDGLNLNKETQSENAEDENEPEYDDAVNMLPEVRLSRTRINATKLARSGYNEEAVNEKIRMIALVRIIYGDYSVNLARAYVELAEGYLKLRKLPLQATKHAGTARDILLELEATRGNEYNMSENRAESASVLELIYFVLGKASKMLKHYKKADNLLQKAHLVQTKKANDCGATLVDTYKTLETLTLLGEVCRIRKQNGHAMEWFEKAVELVEAKLGSESNELILLYQHIGKTELQLGKHANFERVFDIYEKARTVASSVCGKTSVEYADSCASLANAYIAQGDRIHSASAETALEEAIMVYRSVLGANHRKTLDCEENICRLYLQGRKFNEAEGKVALIIKGKKEKYGEISEPVADSYKTLGGLFLSQNKFKLAMPKLLKSKEIYTVVLGPQHKKTKNLSKVIESIKKSPATNELSMPDEKLKERPRFNNTVSGPKTFAFTKTVGY